MRPLPDKFFSRVAVTGSAGQVGYRLVETLRHRSHTVIPFDRATFDLSNVAQLSPLLDAASPTLIFHAGAYSQVDAAETDRTPCETVNFHATAEIARWCKSNGVPLVFYSTDYVFDGRSSTPYVPESPRAPLNWYGNTKAQAEEALCAMDFPALILRTQWVFDSRGQNFLRTILRLLAEKPTVQVVDDQFGSPTYAKDLAEGSVDLVMRWLSSENPQAQIRHLTNQGTTTWFEFASAIRREALARNTLSTAGDLVAIPSEKYLTAAIRPQRSVLDLHRTLTEGISLRRWETALTRCFDEG